MAFVNKLFLLYALAFGFTNGVLVKLQTRNLPNRNNIVLLCTDDSEVALSTTNLGLRRTTTVEGQSETEEVTDFDVEENGKISFAITPSAEGNYSCVDLDNNVQSTNSLAIVASPIIDETFVIPSIESVPLGSSASLPCTFEAGELLEYYEVSWFLGSVSLDVGNGSKYEISSNFTLTIFEVDLQDGSDGYYCKVVVRDPVMQLDYSALGYDVSLIVYGGLDLHPQSLYDTAVKVGSPIVTFTCMVESAPAGRIRWLINGTDVPANNRYTIRSEQVTSTLTTSTVNSSLEIADPEPHDSSLVQCVGYVDNGIETLIESSRATLDVIGNDINPVFTETSSGSLLLTFTLPGAILNVFTVHIRFTSTSNPQETHEIELFDSTFYNTAIVDGYEIPRERLPTTFSSFTGSLAIEVLGVMGDYSPPSSTIDLSMPASTNTVSTTSRSEVQTSAASTRSSSSHQSSTTTMLKPSSTTLLNCAEKCNDSSPGLLAAIAILVVLLVIVMVILIATCIYLCASRKKIKNRKQTTYETELKQTNPGYTDTSPSSCSCHSETPCSHEGHTRSPTSVSGNETHSYSTIDDHNRNTPSRPSSQESFYPDRSRTVSPMDHIYENDETKEMAKKMKEEVYEREKQRTMSSIAVGTSPPRDGKEIIIPIFSKGQSASPRKTEEKQHNNGLLSPARSDPSLESSLKSEYSSHSKNKAAFSQSIAIPSSAGRTRDQPTLTSPTEVKKNPLQPTYQEFKYGQKKPPVVSKKPDELGEEKIYQKIINEYDVV